MFALLLSFFTHSLLATSISVIGPCSSTPLFDSQAAYLENLGDFTISTFEKNKIPYEGSREGIVTIFNSPKGDAAIEVLENNKIRAYGWCVTVDGFEPAEMPHNVKIKDPDSKVVWFYAFSLFDNGDWKDYCTPSYKVKSLPVCSK